MFLITIFDSQKNVICTKFTGREVLYPPISKVTHPMHHSMVSLSQQNAQYSYPRREIENAETIAFAEIAIFTTNVSGGIHWTVTSPHTIDQRDLRGHWHGGTAKLQKISGEVFRRRCVDRRCGVPGGPNWYGISFICGPCHGHRWFSIVRRHVQLIAIDGTWVRWFCQSEGRSSPKRS